MTRMCKGYVQERVSKRITSTSTVNKAGNERTTSNDISCIRLKKVKKYTNKLHVKLKKRVLFTYHKNRV